MRRNGLMLLVAAALLFAAWGGRMPAQASPTLDTTSVTEPVLAQGEA